MEDLVSFMQWHKERGSALKEEEMQCVDCGVKCADVPICDKCNDNRRVRCARAAERRALYREAYMAALGGYCSRPYYDAPDGQRQELNPSRCARIDALETVRQWDEMISQLDGEDGI